MCEFTATEIAEALCKADGLQLAAHSTIYNRVKYLAKREILVPTRRLDARGTLAFGPLEVYRAAVFCELVGLAMDVRALDAVKAAATAHFEGNAAAPSQMIKGGRYSRGALQDAVKGVAAGEEWSLKLWRVNPGLRIVSDQHGTGVELSPEKIDAAYVWAGAGPLWSPRIDAIFQRKPTRALLSVDLQECFRDLIPIAGLPE